MLLVDTSARSACRQYAYGEITILTADSGAAALELLARHDVAVIVADQRMAPMTGTEFLEHSMTIRPDAVRIVLTGYADVDAIVRAINASHVYNYVRKPWQTHELRVTIRRAIETFHLQRTNRGSDELARKRPRQEKVFRPHLHRHARSSSRAGMLSVRRWSRASHRRLDRVIAGRPTGKALWHAPSRRSPRRDPAILCRSTRVDRGSLLRRLSCTAAARTGAVGDRKVLFEVSSGGRFSRRVSDPRRGAGEVLRVPCTAYPPVSTASRQHRVGSSLREPGLVRFRRGRSVRLSMLGFPISSDAALRRETYRCSSSTYRSSLRQL